MEARRGRLCILAQVGGVCGSVAVQAIPMDEGYNGKFRDDWGGYWLHSHSLMLDSSQIGLRRQQRTNERVGRVHQLPRRCVATPQQSG
jgi:hypothetical protein